jgi:imidazolonepropionase-like amidohydrolase
LAERKIPIVGTLDANQLFSGQCPDALSNARRFVAAQGRLLYGTDYPAVPARLDVEELSLMRQAGMSTIEVLRAATKQAARELGAPRLGTITRGARADILVVRGDPTRSLGALRRPALVMVAGRRVR